MPFAKIKVIDGVFNNSEKRKLIENVTDAVVSVAGELLRDKTIVILKEAKSHDWGIGGQPVKAE